MQYTQTIHDSLLPDGPCTKVAHAGGTRVPQELPSAGFTLGLDKSTDPEFLCQAVP